MKVCESSFAWLFWPPLAARWGRVTAPCGSRPASAASAGVQAELCLPEADSAAARRLVLPIGAKLQSMAKKESL